MELVEKVGGTEWNLRHGRLVGSAKTEQVAARAKGKQAVKVTNKGTIVKLKS